MSAPVHARDMDDEQFRKACADADRADRRATLARHDAAELARIMEKHGTVAAAEAPQPPGTETGTTASLARAPGQPTTTTRNAMQMSNAEFEIAVQAAIHNAESIEANRPTHSAHAYR